MNRRARVVHSTSLRICGTVAANYVKPNLSLIFFSLIVLSAVPACGPSVSGGDARVDTPVVATDSPAGGLYAPMGFTVTPELSATPMRRFTEATMVLEANKDYAVVIETDVPGRMVLDLTEVETPITVNSFVFLARNHLGAALAC